VGNQQKKVPKILIDDINNIPSFTPKNNSIYGNMSYGNYSNQSQYTIGKVKVEEAQPSGSDLPKQGFIDRHNPFANKKTRLVCDYDDDSKKTYDNSYGNNYGKSYGNNYYAGGNNYYGNSSYGYGNNYYGNNSYGYGNNSYNNSYGNYSSNSYQNYGYYNK
ncbi:MAG: hypothetical protein MJ252_11955, partial [archaeon]|nr:hypothetical protein [archaeon]